MIIQSLQNPRIKHVVQLQDKKHRVQHQEFIAQGLKTCTTLMASGYELKTIFMTEAMYLAHQNDFLVQDTHLVTDVIMKHISTTTTPTGIVAIFAIPQQPTLITKNAVILHGIQDPGNLGTLIRTATAMNIQALYLIECVDLYNPKVIQATTGCLGTLNIAITSWSTLKTEIGSIPTCALVVKSGKLPQDIPLQDTILIIGNEGQGLPKDITEQCTYTMTLPMHGNTESLNAAVAGSIAMYLKSQD